MSVKKGKESLFGGRVKGKVKGLVNSLFRVGINRKNKKRLKNQGKKRDFPPKSQPNILDHSK